MTVGEDLPPVIEYHSRDYPNVANAEPIIIVGFGPSGMFAALRCIELGYKPIVIEEEVMSANVEEILAAINKHQIVNPESNYCFGEGEQALILMENSMRVPRKRGDIQKSLEILVAHGATEEILVDAHPHIGTNKLPKVVQEIRESVLLVVRYILTQR